MRTLLIISALLVSLTSFGQVYKSDKYTFEVLSSGETSVRIVVKYMSRDHDEIDLKEIDIDEHFYQYRVGLFGRAFTDSNVEKMYFGNFRGVYEYNIKKRTVKQILPLKDDLENVTYRIQGVINDQLIVLQGRTVGNKPYTKLVEHIDSNKYVQLFYDTSTGDVGRMMYISVPDVNGGVYIRPTNK